MKALIALEDGRIFEGRSFTGHGEVAGEIVFNTSMTGYQEILTDPSYSGQLVTMTYPLIGNYGTVGEDDESDGIHAGAIVMREYEENYSNWRADRSLREYLDGASAMGIDQVDTRAVTRHIRLAGAMKAVISTDISDPDALVAKARASRGLTGLNLAEKVTTTVPYIWKGGVKHPLEPGMEMMEAVSRQGRDFDFLVAVIDCGLKFNQLRLFEARGCRCAVFPSSVTADEIMSIGPDGIFVSNGPGDPSAVTDVIKTVSSLLGRRPVFGICLGHQILGLALGGSTFKLKFGHRGGNQPVRDMATGKIEITSQNHGFAVDGESLPPEVEITHVNLNDNTLEGIRHRGIKAFSVQYHPENAPGPRDSEYLFDRFERMMAGE
jgi:carbamoyl-phosphate synthase small subunit